MKKNKKKKKNKNKDKKNKDKKNKNLYMYNTTIILKKYVQNFLRLNPPPPFGLLIKNVSPLKVNQ